MSTVKTRERIRSRHGFGRRSRRGFAARGAEPRHPAGDRQRTLEDAVLAAFNGLVVSGSASCPVCTGEGMTPAGCPSCGSQLS